jgi:hypothetical protein
LLRHTTFQRLLMSDGNGPDLDLDEEGLDYLSKLTEALKKRNKMPYKPRVQGKDREPVAPPSSPAVQKFTPTETPQATPMPVHRPSGDQIKRPAYNQPVLSPLGAGTFPMGTILRLEDQTICIYKDVRPNKDYEVVLMLGLDGSVKAEGIALATYDLKSIGQLPPEFVMGIQRRQRWNRDEIIYHLSSFDYCELVPHPQSAPASPTPPPQASQQTPRPSQEAVRTSQVVQKPSFSAKQEEQKMLVPGREISISFGPNQEWKALYWGEDDLGTIIAHCTNNNWSLMHMDLSRFKESIKYGGVVDRTLMDHIHATCGQH